MPQPLLELGGRKGQPVMHIAPANGFVLQTYLPLLRPFMAAYHTLALPPRALWDDGPPPPVTADSDWTLVAHDLKAGLKRYDLREVVALGHSFGGIATLLAALDMPERFRAVILLDPTILTPEFCAWIANALANGTSHEHPLAQMAARRRRAFESVEAAYTRFRGKGLFADWPDEGVRLYAEYATKPSANGERHLTWPPEWEEFYFATGYPQIWETLPQVKDLTVPLLVMNGGESDTFLPQSVNRMRNLVPQATYHTIEGHGHLFPQSAPGETAEVIEAWLSNLS